MHANTHCPIAVRYAVCTCISTHMCACAHSFHRMLDLALHGLLAVIEAGLSAWSVYPVFSLCRFGRSAVTVDGPNAVKRKYIAVISGEIVPVNGEQ